MWDCTQRADICILHDKHLCYAKWVCAAAGATIAGCQAGLPSSAHAADSIQSLVHTIPSPVADIADEVPFWANVLRYVQYFFSIMLGTGYVMLKPFAQLLRNPVTGVLVIAAAVGLVIGVKITVTAMLGVDDLFDYQASSIVTAQGM